MSVGAQLAQLSKLYIAGTTGTAKTITGIAPGYPTIITSAAHGLSNGDSCAIAAITGTIGTDATNGLNGKTLTITNVTTNTFSVNVNTVGLLYTSGGTATPSAWIKINQIKSYKPSGASASTIDVTDLDSIAKEFLTGLVDNGTLSADVFYLASDAGQAAVLAAFKSSLSKTYKLTINGGATFTYAASVTKCPTLPDLAVDGVLTGQIDWKVSGDVTVS